MTNGAANGSSAPTRGTTRRTPFRRSRSNPTSESAPRWPSRRWTVVGTVVLLIAACAYAWFVDAEPADPKEFGFDIRAAAPEPWKRQMSHSSAVAAIGNDSYSRIHKKRIGLGRELTWEERQEALDEYYETDLFRDELRFALLEIKRYRPRRPVTDFSGPTFPGRDYLRALTLLCDFSRGTEAWKPCLEQLLESTCCRGIGELLENRPYEPLWTWLQISIPHWSEAELATALEVWPEDPFLPLAHEIAHLHRSGFDNWAREMRFVRQGGMNRKQIRSLTCQYNYKPVRTRNAFLRDLDRQLRRVERRGACLPRFADEGLAAITWWTMVQPNGLGRESRDEYEFHNQVRANWRALGSHVEESLLFQNAVRARLHLLRHPEWGGDLSEVPGFRVAKGTVRQRYDPSRRVITSPTLVRLIEKLSEAPPNPFVFGPGPTIFCEVAVSPTPR